MEELETNNVTLCSRYIPDVDEYHDALGWIWLLFVILGSVTCLLLYGLFLEQLFTAIDKAHVVFRNSVIWISSLYPFMTLMTIVGFVIPRSQVVCYTVKVFYMYIAISKFADLTLCMYGSEEVMLWTLRKSELKLNVGPVCCFCFCLPRVTAITKVKLRLIFAGVRQLPYTQSFYLVMIMILQSANQIVVGSLDPRGTYVWLNIFSVITSLSGVYCLNILSDVSSQHLHRYVYERLSFVMKSLIIVTKFQSLVFNILAYYEVFPCVPPISHYVYRETVENWFYIVEMLLFGIYSYSIYRKVEFSSANPAIIRLDPQGNIRPFHQAYLPSLSGSLDAYGGGQPSADFLDDGPAGEHSPTPSGEPGFTRDAYDFGGAVLVINETSASNTNSGYEQFN